MYPQKINRNKNKNNNENLIISLQHITSCLRVYYNYQPRLLEMHISLIPRTTTHFSTRFEIEQLTIQLTMQLTSKLDTITQISKTTTRSTTHFTTHCTTHSNSTRPCTAHHLATPLDMYCFYTLYAITTKYE